MMIRKKLSMVGVLAFILSGSVAQAEELRRLSTGELRRMTEQPVGAHLYLHGDYLEKGGLTAPLSQRERDLIGKIAKLRAGASTYNAANYERRYKQALTWSIASLKAEDRRELRKLLRDDPAKAESFVEALLDPSPSRLLTEPRPAPAKEVFGEYYISGKDAGAGALEPVKPENQ